MPDLSTPQSDLLDIPALAAFLGVGPGTVYSLTRSRARRDDVPLPCLRIGKRVYVRRSSLLAWIEQRELARMGGMR
jgi:predicted DNA-binding transcriptional regulator AlpA